MKPHKILLLSAIALVLTGVCMVSNSCGTRTRAKGPDTLKINTSALGADIIGFNGPTPVEVCVFNGVITEIKALPNQETPRFFQRVIDSGLLNALNGKTPAEAKEIQLDAVSGATYSSNAVIKNIRLALESVE
jgi:uncharacterized protein with FMN-binding domain